MASKSVLITGGGTGLGKAMSLRFASLGAHVTIFGRRRDMLESAVGEINKMADYGADFHVVDIRDSAAVEDCVATVMGRRKLDVLVNNAAANFVAQTHTLSSRAVDAVLQTTLHGTIYITLAVGKTWITEGQVGTILSIVSPNAFTGSPYAMPSAAGKAGVLAMTKSLAVEWGARGIRLVAIAPGTFPTPGAWRNVVPREDLAKQFETNNPLRRPGRHEELANLAVFLASDQAGYINGECVTIDGGRWLKGAGAFSFLETLSEDDWKTMRRGRNA
jgi:NAD(P)-dependent dehydrogenase (short-subunit alcohol dehydrogenase family)